MKYYCGIDIGSTAIKIALVDQEGNLAGARTTPTGCRFHHNAMQAFESLVGDNGHKQVACTMATGYGRKLFRQADDSVSEITANAVGGYAVGKKLGGVRTIINIGGQDTKAIHIDTQGRVTNFVMNDKCAAGTGRFLEVAARNLEVDIENLGEYHMLASELPPAINSTCAVFAESEIISLLAAGHGKAEIIVAIHRSIARRTMRLARRAGLGGRVLFDGGPAMNKGLASALEEALLQEIIIPADPGITTALGAAVLARDRDR